MGCVYITQVAVPFESKTHKKNLHRLFLIARMISVKCIRLNISASHTHWMDTIGKTKRKEDAESNREIKRGKTGRRKSTASLPTSTFSSQTFLVGYPLSHTWPPSNTTGFVCVCVPPPIFPIFFFVFQTSIHSISIRYIHRQCHFSSN